MNAGTNAGALNTGGLPRGELLGRYRSYEDAQKVVDHLTAADGFDVKALTIVGNDLRSVEHIRTRLTYPRVALGGAAQGAMFGAFIGLLIYLFSPEANIYNLVFSVVLGMAIWMIIGVIGFGMRKGRREYASSSQLVATTFDVVCEFSAAHRARQLVPGAGVMSLNAYTDPTSQASARLAPAQGASAPSPWSGQPASGQQSAGQHGPGQQGSGQHGAGHHSAVQQGSAELSAGVQEPEQTTTAPDPTPQQPVAGYNDLPDGRPRYGVRRPAADEEPAEPSTGAAPAEPSKTAEPTDSPAPSNGNDGTPRS